MDLTFVLTEECNLRCSYCYQREFRPTTLPVSRAVTCMEKAIAAGVESLSLTFFGGEPLLRAKEMFEILEAARRLEARLGKPIPAKVATNGALLDQEIVDRGASLGLFFSLSLDGNGRAQDAGRLDAHGESCFENVSNALDLLVAAAQPFAVYSVITPENVRTLDRSVRFLWDAGARIMINTVDYTSQWEQGDIAALAAQITKLGSFYERLLRLKRSFHLEPFDSRISKRTRAGEWGCCSPGVQQVTLGPDGTLYGCVEYFHEAHLPLGNAESWLDDGAVRQLLRVKGKLPDSCRKCALLRRCNNRCACANLRGTGLAGEPSSALCELERTTIMAVDQVASRLYGKKVLEFITRQYSCGYHALTTIEKLLEEMEVPS